MECEDCEYRKFDHHIEGSPASVYECGHPDALEIWAIYDGEKCPADVNTTQSRGNDQQTPGN